MNLILKGKKVDFTDEEEMLIKKTLLEFNTSENTDSFNFEVDGILYYSYSEFEDLISYFMKEKENLLNELILRLIWILVNHYCCIIREQISIIDEELQADDEFFQNINDNNQELLQKLQNYYFELKSKIIDIEYKIDFLTFTLMSGLNSEKNVTYKEIKGYQKIAKYIATFHNFIKYLEIYFEREYEYSDNFVTQSDNRLF